MSIREKDIGCRVEYTKLGGTTVGATVKDVRGAFVSLAVDGSKRKEYWVPQAMVKLVDDPPSTSC